MQYGIQYAWLNTVGEFLEGSLAPPLYDFQMFSRIAMTASQLSVFASLFSPYSGHAARP